MVNLDPPPLSPLILEAGSYIELNKIGDSILP